MLSQMINYKMIGQCLLMASLHYQVPVDALLAMMEVEGGRSGMESRNDNGSVDLGLMQINTCWLKPLARAWGKPRTHVRRLIRDNDCLNINVAAYILRRKIIEGQGNLLAGIARYNSATPKYGQRYLKKVIAAYNRQRHLKTHQQDKASLWSRQP